jgi:hypothetical protein
MGIASRYFNQIGDEFRHPQATTFAGGRGDEFRRRRK